MTKQELRKEYLTKRKALTHAERLQLQEMLVKQLGKIPLPDIHFAMSYIPITAKAEIDTTLAENFLKKQFSGCRICYPKTQLGVFNMEAIVHAEGMALAGSPLGIEEPVSGEIIEPQQIDLIIVPLLCLDIRGYRVGYGKGFYDRFIARCRRDVITIGLSFFDPVESIEDVDVYDIPLRFCLTPERLYHFQE